MIQKLVAVTSYCFVGATVAKGRLPIFHNKAMLMFMSLCIWGQLKLARFATFKAQKVVTLKNAHGGGIANAHGKAGAGVPAVGRAFGPTLLWALNSLFLFSPPAP
jgi:hypothetical protein